MERRKVSAGRAWSDVGYSRAIRVGSIIEVAGTAASAPSGEVVFVGDMYQQTKYAIAIMKSAIETLGGSVSDVVRTRIFVTDISRWEEAGRAHGEVFGDIRPASTMVEVSSLIHPDMLVEIEATAVVDVVAADSADAG